MSYEFIKYPEVEPEGTAQERLWQSVLMDFPYYAGASSNQSAFVQASRAGSFAAGHLAKGSTELQAYVSRWIFAGFTPYMYWALCGGIKSAAEHARQLCKDADDLLRLEERMHWLGVLSPNPRAGQLYNRAEKTDSGEWTIREEQYPDYIGQLVPEAWAEFPGKLQFARPSAALQQYIYGNREEGSLN